jgi:hypothetical protein
MSVLSHCPYALGSRIIDMRTWMGCKGVGAGHDDGAGSDGLSIGIPPLFPETPKGQGQAVLLEG